MSIAPIALVALLGLSILAACTGSDSPAVAPPSQPATASESPSPADTPSPAALPAQPTETSAPGQQSSVALQTPASARNLPTAAPTQPAAPAASSQPADQADEGGSKTVQSSDLEIVTLLPFDAIPAILKPEFVDVDQANEWLDPDHLVLGLSIDGDNRAYSVPMLSAHEIVNDTVGGQPVAVTW